MKTTNKEAFKTIYEPALVFCFKKLDLIKDDNCGPEKIKKMRANFLVNLNDLLQSLIGREGSVAVAQNRIKRIFVGLTAKQQQFINACYYSLKKLQLPKSLEEIEEMAKSRDDWTHVDQPILSAAVSSAFSPLSKILCSMVIKDSTPNPFIDDSLDPVFQIFRANYDEIRKHTMRLEGLSEESSMNQSNARTTYGTFKSV